MLGRKRNRPSNPTQAYLQLTNGDRIPCTIREEPERNEDGLRVFTVQPIRLPAPHEEIANAYIDVLPPMSTANFLIPLPKDTMRADI